MTAPPRLFEVDVPDGFRYQREFLSRDEERLLTDAIARIEFSAFELRGVVARRRVAFFGGTYNEGAAASPALPEFLLPLRDKVAAWASVDAEAFAMALINEYVPGAPIGWHRDAPQYDIVAGVSLRSPCRMKFRPYLAAKMRGAPQAPRRATHEITLEPRSVYLLTADARSAYEHHIPAVAALRYSVTFRTLRRPRTSR